MWVTRLRNFDRSAGVEDLDGCMSDDGFEPRIEPAAVRKARKPVKAREMLELRVGDAKITLALCEPFRHSVKGGRERREFGGPTALAGIGRQVAMTDVARHTGKRAKRTD